MDRWCEKSKEEINSAFLEPEFYAADCRVRMLKVRYQIPQRHQLSSLRCSEAFFQFPSVWLKDISGQRWSRDPHNDRDINLPVSQWRPSEPYYLCILSPGVGGTLPPPNIPSHTPMTTPCWSLQSNSNDQRGSPRPLSKIIAAPYTTPPSLHLCCFHYICGGWVCLAGGACMYEWACMGVNALFCLLRWHRHLR